MGTARRRRHLGNCAGAAHRPIAETRVTPDHRARLSRRRAGRAGVGGVGFGQATAQARIASMSAKMSASHILGNPLFERVEIGLGLAKSPPPRSPRSPRSQMHHHRLIPRLVLHPVWAPCRTGPWRNPPAPWPGRRLRFGPCRGEGTTDSSRRCRADRRPTRRGPHRLCEEAFRAGRRDRSAMAEKYCDHAV